MPAMLRNSDAGVARLPLPAFVSHSRDYGRGKEFTQLMHRNRLMMRATIDLLDDAQQPGVFEQPLR